MSDAEYLAEIMKKPTECHQSGCTAENELLMHLTDDPWGGADFCYPHARKAFANTPLVWTCECTFCVRARNVLPRHEHEAAGADAVLCEKCTGRHVITTASGTRHLIDLDLKVVLRVPDGANPLVPYTGEFLSADLRRDGEPLRLVGLYPVFIGQPAFMTIDLQTDDPDYRYTTRSTTPVVTVEVV